MSTNHSTDVCFSCLSNNNEWCYINNRASIECRIDAVRANAWNLALIKTQTPEICMEAVKQCGQVLILVKEQTPEIAYEAVKQNGFSIVSSKFFTPKICVALNHEKQFCDSIEKTIVKYFENIGIEEPETFFKFLVSRNFCLTGSFMLHVIESVLGMNPQWLYDDVDIMCGNGSYINIEIYGENSFVNLDPIHPESLYDDTLDHNKIYCNFTKYFTRMDKNQSQHIIDETVQPGGYRNIGGVATYVHNASGKKFQFIVPRHSRHSRTAVIYFDISVCRNMYGGIFGNKILYIESIRDIVRRQFSCNFEDDQIQNGKTEARIKKYENRGFVYKGIENTVHFKYQMKMIEETNRYENCNARNCTEEGEE